MIYAGQFFLADEVVVLSGRPATAQYKLKIDSDGPRTLDDLYTLKAAEQLNILRRQIEGARRTPKDEAA